MKTLALASLAILSLLSLIAPSSAFTGAAASLRKVVDFGNASNYTSIYRLVRPDFSEYVPPDLYQHRCFWLDNHPYPADASTFSGICSMYWHKKSCGSALPGLWSWIKSVMDIIFSDPCCRTNMERIGCLLGASPLLSWGARNVDGKVTLYVSNRTATAYWNSCLSSCAERTVRKIENETPEQFVNNINLNAIFSYAFDIAVVVGYNPTNNLTIDVEMIQQCGAIHTDTEATMCEDCYVLSDNSTLKYFGNVSIPTVSHHEGYCSPSDSEMSDCCVHDGKFTWGNKTLFKTSNNSECLTNILRLQCACLCLNHSAYVSGSVCYIDSNEASLLYDICSDSSFHNETVPLNSLFEDADSLITGLSGSTMSFRVGSTQSGGTLSGVCRWSKEEIDSVADPVVIELSSSWSSIAKEEKLIWGHSAENVIIAASVGAAGLLIIVTAIVTAVVTITRRKQKNISNTTTNRKSMICLDSIEGLPKMTDAGVIQESPNLPPVIMVSPPIHSPSPIPKGLSKPGYYRKVETLYDSDGRTVSFRQLILDGNTGTVVSSVEVQAVNSGDRNGISPIPSPVMSAAVLTATQNTSPAVLSQNQSPRPCSSPSMAHNSLQHSN